MSVELRDPFAEFSVDWVFSCNKLPNPLFFDAEESLTSGLFESSMYRAMSRLSNGAWNGRASSTGGYFVWISPLYFSRNFSGPKPWVGLALIEPDVAAVFCMLNVRVTHV